MEFSGIEGRKLNLVDILAASTRLSLSALPSSRCVIRKEQYLAIRIFVRKVRIFSLEKLSLSLVRLHPSLSPYIYGLKVAPLVKILRSPPPPPSRGVGDHLVSFFQNNYCILIFGTFIIYILNCKNLVFLLNYYIN